MGNDPLGLTPEQRAISDRLRGPTRDAHLARLLDEMTMACPLCRAYECLPGCLSRLAADMPPRPWTFTPDA